MIYVKGSYGTFVMDREVSPENNRRLYSTRTVETAKTRKITPNDSAAINGSLYESIEVPWKIAGEEFDVRLANEITLTKFEQYYPGIKKYLSDYLEFYRK